MKPEREAEIRAVLNGDLSVGMDDALPVVSKAADDLLDEVDRLRAGIEALVGDPAAHETYEGGAHACVDADDLSTLLNPPTEGEADE